MTQSSLDINTLFSLNDKVALVTGGSRGIGYMIAQGLLQAGARVYISARKAAACEEAATALSEFGQCIALPADLADRDSCQQLCDSLRERESSLDILVNNAGTVWAEEYETYPEAAFDKVLKLNVTSIFTLTRDLTPLLEKGNGATNPARVINIGSMDGLHIPVLYGDIAGYAYTTSKAAVHHLTRHLAVELGPKNITVNAIAPGFFPSKMTDELFDSKIEAIEGNSLLGRAGTAEEMAGLAIYLSGRAGAFTHGAVIPVDGGTSINHNHSVPG